MAHSGIRAGAAPWTAGPTALRAGRPRGHPPAVAVRMRPMKWWGWGDEGIAFTHEDKPELGPFIARAIGVDVTAPAERAVLDADAVVIPFGGGTNIAGSLEAPGAEERTVVSLDLGRLRRVLDIDEASGLARIQAGALGPDIERQLEARGFTLGHFP